MVAFKHAPERAVGVVAALVGPLAALVVDPSVDDDFAGLVVTEEQVSPTM
jgi:hypothetical protein